MRKHHGLVWLALAVVAAVLPSPQARAQSSAQLAAQGLAAGGGDKVPFPLHLLMSQTTSVGSGTFTYRLNEGTRDGSTIINDYPDGTLYNPQVATGLMFRPWALVGPLQFAVQQSLSYEWTPSEFTTLGNQISLDDTSVTARWNPFNFRDIGTIIGFSGGFTLPISLASRQVGQATSLSLGGRVVYQQPSLGLFVVASVGGRYNILVPALSQHTLDEPQKPFEDRTLGSVTPSGCLLRDPTEERANYACLDGVLPSAASVTSSINASWSTPDGAWTLSAGLAYINIFRAYEGKDDALRSIYALPGVGRTELTNGSLSVSYQPLDWVTFTLGTDSTQLALTADQSAIRFPFWDFLGPAENRSSLYLDTTFTFN